MLASDQKPVRADAHHCAVRLSVHLAIVGITKASRIADAEELSKDLSPEASAVARKKEQICNRFNIAPAELTSQHVLDISNAFPALRNRLLDDNTTALGLFTHGRLKQLGDAYVLDRARTTKLHLQLHWVKELTTQACAADLLTKEDCFSTNED